MEDEWIEYLKTGRIDEHPKARGLMEAKECLRLDLLGDEERAQYIRHLDNLRVQWDVLTTAREEGLDEGLEKGKEEMQLEIAKRLKTLGVAFNVIAESSGLSEAKIEKL